MPIITYKYFSCNSFIKPASEAVIPLSDVAYTYGFGVYETIRVNKGVAYFLGEHCRRLLESAKIISLEHGWTPEAVSQGVEELITKNRVKTCNVKVLLIGGQTSADANLYIQCLNPLFPDRKLYKTGAHCITQRYERPFAHAKTLNMLPSYLAFRQAKQAGAYDALCVNRDGNVTEGTRTNFFVIKDKTISSPPEAEILLGVTRDHVLRIASQNGYEVVERDIALDSLDQYDGAFLTSTSSKIMPIKSIDDHQFGSVPEALKELMSAFDQFLAEKTE